MTPEEKNAVCFEAKAPHSHPVPFPLPILTGISSWTCIEPMQGLSGVYVEGNIIYANQYRMVNAIMEPIICTAITWYQSKCSVTCKVVRMGAGRNAGSCFASDACISATVAGAIREPRNTSNAFNIVRLVTPTMRPLSSRIRCTNRHVSRMARTRYT